MVSQNNVVIPRFSAAHIPQVAQIERNTFSEPWSENSLALLCTEEYPSFVLTDEDGEVLGYVSTAKALDELQMINLAIKADCRGRGFAKLLLSALDDFCQTVGIESVSLEVRESNAAAISLYEKLGYEKVGLRRGFYRLPPENAVIMVKKQKI